MILFFVSLREFYPAVSYPKPGPKYKKTIILVLKPVFDLCKRFNHCKVKGS